MSIPKKAIFVTAGTLVLAYLAWVVVYNVFYVPHNYPLQPTTQPAVVTETHPVASEIFTEVNDERIKAGLASLVEDGRLDASAAAKCNDEVVKNYWDHNDPSGRTPWHFILEQGVIYRYAAENIARGQHTSQEVVTQWMDSPGHRANILNPHLTHVGYAVCHSDNFLSAGPQDLVVQHFTGL